MKKVNTTFNRSTEEYIMLTLSGATSICILPFAIYRFVQHDWAVATLDTVAVLVAAALYFYVFITHKTLVPSRIFAFLALSVVFVTVTLKGVDQLLWIYPALTAIFFVLPPKVAAGLSSTVLVGLGVVLKGELTLFLALELYISATATLVFIYVFADRMRKQQAQLTELATKDPLTGAGNRRALEQRLLDVVALQRRDSSSPASLILMDLDKFKSINDEFGHAKGDEMLVAFANAIQSRIRQADKFYRFGGEEFVVIAENTPLKDAIVLAEELRQCIESNSVLTKYALTISVGTASYEADETAYEWLGRADSAMYQAKAKGRNYCCVAQTIGTQNGNNLI